MVSPEIILEHEPTVTLRPPEPGQHIIMSGTEGGTFRFGFNPASERVGIVDGDLVFIFPNHGKITIQGFSSEHVSAETFFVLPDGKELSLEEFLDTFNIEVFNFGQRGGFDSIPESGLVPYEDDPGALVDGIDRLGKLGTIYWSGATNLPEIYEGLLALHNGDIPGRQEVILFGTISASLYMHEDGQPFKNTLAPGENPANGAADTTLETDYDPVTGMPITFSFNGVSETPMPADPDAVYVFSLTIGRLPGADQGVIMYNGEPVSQGQVISNPDLGAFSFKPTEYYSGDVDFNFSYTLATGKTGPATRDHTTTGTLRVDSVADLPDAESQATGDTANGDNLILDAPVFENGWAEQSVAGGQSMDVTFDVTGHFYDLDSSEIGWIDVQLPQGFSIPPGSDYSLVRDATGSYARIPLGNLSVLRGPDGTVTVPVTLVMDTSTIDGDKQLAIRVVAREADNRDTDGHSTDNNQAERVIEQDTPIDILVGSVEVNVGWAYEGNKYGGTATSDIATLNLDSASTSSVGAPISFIMSNGTLTEATVTIDPALGTLYYGGSALTPGSGGIYTLNQTQLASNAVTFVPSGHSDSDVALSYTLTGKDTNGHIFTFTGESTVVIDAVADAGMITAPITAVIDRDNATFDITVNAVFADIDGSERHYILVEYNEGWTSPDPYDRIVIYYDSDGNPLPPGGFDPDTGEYLIDITGYAYYIPYFRFDVTDQSEQANGTATDYTVRVTPPQNVTDMYLKVGTMSEELPANLNGTEYDLANNIAVSTQDTLINVVDTTVLISAIGAYENHSPNQNTGDTAPISTDGIITISLQGNDDLNRNPGEDKIVITFTYDPADPTAEPTPGSFYSYQTGQTYSFGNTTDNYSFTRIPGTNQYELIVYGRNIPTGNNSFRIRYNPPTDDDTDITGITASVPVESDSGQKQTVITDPIDMTVDAVANKPVDVEATPNYDGTHTAVASGADVDVTLTAQFGDWQDNSEEHFIVIDLNSGFNSIDSTTLPAGVSQLTIAQIQAAGLDSYVDTDRYLVYHVPDEYLRANNGLFNATVTAGLDTVAQDSTLKLGYIAVSVDKTTNDDEITINNNYAATVAENTIEVHTVTSVPVLYATVAFENDTPNANTGNSSPANGAHISLSGMDASEKIQTLTITWDESQGELYYNGQSIVTGTSDGVTFSYSSGSLTMTQTNVSGVDAAVGKLTFVPSQNYSDQDTSLTYSGTVVDTASGMTKDFGAGKDIPTTPVPVIIDAVAQQPIDAGGVVSYPGAWTAAHDLVNVSSSATFFDTIDGSEQHFLLIEIKSYFSPTTLIGTDGASLITVGYNGTTPLTPDGSGGWLSPNPSTPGDHSAIATSTKTFLKIPVDDLIEAGRGFTLEEPTAVDNFVVTRHADGSFTVTYNTDIHMDTIEMTRDFSDTLVTGGMSVENATKAGGDADGGKEQYTYNNTAYGLTSNTLEVAVVGTTNVSLLTGWASENNSPDANTGQYHNGNGAGILAVRTDPGVAGQDYSDEQITLIFTYDSLYKDATTGEWVIPGTITYNYSGAEEVTTFVNPATGLVTATVIISTGDTDSLVSSTAVSPNADDSNIRFVPSLLPDGSGNYYNNFNESDINLGYTVRAQDLASGDTASVGGGKVTIAIDAVADQPTINNLGWEYDQNSDDHIAFSDGNITLRFEADFPDTAPTGVVSEGQYILVRQNDLMDLSPEFKLAVAQAGYTIDNYVVSGDTAPYYRIPAAYFATVSGSPAGSHNYDIVLPMGMTGGITEGTIPADAINSELKIYAVTLVNNEHGLELDTSNNSAQTTTPLPDITFAIVDSSVNPSEGKAYEQNAPNANTDDYTPPDDGEVSFSLGLNLGPSLPDADGQPTSEVASDVTINYDGTHGQLFYYNGSTWVSIESINGTIPAAYAGSNLKYEPTRLTNGLGDQDQEIHYSLTITDPASGAEKTFSGNIPVIVDAVAQQPNQPDADNLNYSSGDGQVSYNESVSFTVSATFKDFDKSDNSHSRYYILIQQPGTEWTISYPDMDSNPYDVFIYNGEAYFRVPVDPATFDLTGNTSIPITLTAPSDGYLLYNNSRPLNVYAQSVARDPNLSSMLPGDDEIRYDNNWAYSPVNTIAINYDDNNPTLFVVDPLYQNNKPQGNLLGPDGNQVSTPGGGEIHVQDTVGGKPVDHVRLTWDTSQGDLVVNGVTVTPVLIGDGPEGYYDISPSDDAAFQTKITNSDVDMSSVKADFYGDAAGTEDLGSSSYTPVVDAVAQVPTDLTSSTNYGTSGDGTPYTAGQVGLPVDIVVDVTFHDLEDHSERYVLVESKPGWTLPPNTSYAVITGSDGKQYWQVPVNNDDIDPSTGEAKVHVSIVPPASGGTPGPNGETIFELATGAMTVRNPTSGGDLEYRDDNNVSYNVTGNTEVVTSIAESNPVLNVTSTYAGSDNTGSGTPNPNAVSNLYVTGYNQGSDTIPEITLNYNNTNGDVMYNGVPLNGLDGVNYSTDANGNVTAVITNPNIINALASGSAGSSAVQYVPKTYIDSDVRISATFEVHDNFSSDTKSTGNTATVVVDSVAVEAKNVTLEIPGYTGGVVAGTPIPVSASATFIDLANPNPNGHHYLAIEQRTGWTIAGGSMPEGVSVQTYEGVTYYVIDVDVYGDSNLPYLVHNGGDNYTFTLSLQAPESAVDVTDAASISGGAVVVQTPRDQEVSFENNTNVTAKEIPINIGVVETANVSFTISPVTEDSTEGAAISLGTAVQNILSGHNEIVTETTLTFSGDFSGHPSGLQVGTIIYNGKAIPVISNGDGTATAAIDFGAGGYKPSDSINLIWGTVATDDSGNVIYDSPGVPSVTDWNHTGSDMTVTSNSTVVDNASGDSKEVPGEGTVSFVPTADAPTNVTAGDPAQVVGAGAPVTFAVSGQFVDIDGSEEHYYLVQQLPGWTGNYQTVTVDGITYFMVPVSNSTEANPTVNVTLNTPAGITADGSHTLIVSGMSVDGSSSAVSSASTTTTVDVGVVNATGVTLTMDSTAENDGNGTAVLMQFGFIGSPVNDSIKSITITDLQGGTIVDGAGNVLFATAPATLDISDNYYYLPPLYSSGNITLTFTAVGMDNASGATTTFAGQTGTVSVTPVSTEPLDPSGMAGPPVIQPGHQAEVPVTINADFPDTSGTEEHFFLVQLPTGITVPTGFTIVTDTALLNAASMAGMAGPIYKVDSSDGGSASFALTIPSDASADSVTFLAVASEPGQPPAFSSTATNVALPDLGTINLAPDSDNLIEGTPVATTLLGNILLHDPDGDTVNITSVTFNGQSVSEIGGTFTIQGDFGEFSLESDGAYTYTPSAGMTGTDVFSIELQDDHGGTSTTTLTVNVGTTRSLAFDVESDDNALSDHNVLFAAAAFDQDETYEAMLLPENNDWADVLNNYDIPIPGLAWENSLPLLPDMPLPEIVYEIPAPQPMVDDMMLAETIKMLAAG